MSLIARVWFGKTATERLEEYVEYVRSTGVKDLTQTEGNRGVLVWARADGPDEKTGEIGVISLWRSLRDIERFAGANVTKAVYYDRDPEYLLSMEPNVVHYEIPIVEGLKVDDTLAASSSR